MSLSARRLPKEVFILWLLYCCCTAECVAACNLQSGDTVIDAVDPTNWLRAGRSRVPTGSLSAEINGHGTLHADQAVCTERQVCAIMHGGVML
jgi:hypothetical protein